MGRAFSRMETHWGRAGTQPARRPCLVNKAQYTLATPPRKNGGAPRQKAGLQTPFADKDFYTGDPAKFGRAGVEFAEVDAGLARREGNVRAEDPPR
jgi:hypothetical protein